VFYLHSRFLERSAHVSGKYGNGLAHRAPIIETRRATFRLTFHQRDFDHGRPDLPGTDLFYQGCDLPCPWSFSQPRRSAAQIKAMKQVAGRIKGDLAQYRELAPSRSWLGPGRQDAGDPGARQTGGRGFQATAFIRFRWKFRPRFVGRAKHFSMTWRSRKIKDFQTKLTDFLTTRKKPTC